MWSLSECASSSLEDKTSHILILLKKREDKNDVSCFLQMVHDIRLKCLIESYFGTNVPEVVRQKIPMNTWNMSGATSEEKILFQNFSQSLDRIKRGDTTMFDIADRQFQGYRYQMWKKSVSKNGWTKVENRADRKKNYLMNIKIRAL